jgi:hypothetical protein
VIITPTTTTSITTATSMRRCRCNSGPLCNLLRHPLSILCCIRKSSLLPLLSLFSIMPLPNLSLRSLPLLHFSIMHCAPLLI